MLRVSYILAVFFLLYLDSLKINIGARITTGFYKSRTLCTLSICFIHVKNKTEFISIPRRFKNKKKPKETSNK